MHCLSSFRSRTRLLALTMLAVAALVAAGCATHRPAPVEDRTLGREAPRGAPPSQAPTATPELPPAATYTVKRGDTLHQIALDNGLDYRELAAWNNLENPNVIRVGQVLRLTAPDTATAGTPSTGVTTAPLRGAPPVVTETKPAPTAPAVPPATARAGDNVKSSPKALKEAYSERAVREVAAASAAAATGPSAPSTSAEANVPAPARPEAKAEPPPA